MSSKDCILVVDDDESVLRSLSLVLTKKGFEVVQAGTGKEALETVKERRVDLTVLDIKLPDIQGLDLIAPLQKTNPDMAIVMVTGFASVETAVQALTQGASAYITKPVNLDEFLLTIKNTFEHQHLVTKVRLAEEEIRTLNRDLEKRVEERTGELQKANEGLVASETRYRRLFEAAKDGILILNAETGQIVDANPFLINLLGFSHEQFLGKKIWDIGIFKDIVANKDNFKELQSKDYIRYEDLPLETSDGRHIGVEFVSNVYTADTKKVIQCNIRDITERKKMADLINASLAEKETLLKEVHHRVKNNLQIIASLLNLQIRKINDPTTIETLKDCQSRVRSMALVHEHLYRGKDFSHVDLGNYIRALGTVLFNSSEAGNRGVRLDLNIHNIYVDTNTAIPLGLISNELITNSLKYAFKEKKDGRLSIIATEDPVTLTFVVADNGVGMAPGITLENQTSLGLQLVSTLTDQLNGTVMIDRTGGTKFTFTFPKPAEQKLPEGAVK